MVPTRKPQEVVMVYQTDLAPAGQGGGVRYVVGLVDHLLARGWDVTFLGAGTCSRPPHPGLRFISVAARDAPWPLFFLGLARFLRHRAAALRGAVHLHRGYFALPFLLLAPHLPLVCTLHGDTLRVLGGRSVWLKRLALPFFRPLELLSLRGMHRVIAVDPRTAEKFRKRYPFSWLRRKLTVIPSWVDGRAFTPGDKAAARQRLGLNLGDELVLFAGRLSRIKNLPFLLRVFARLEAQRPRARLFIAGDGEDGAALRDYARSLGLTRVTFLGPVPHQEMPWCLRAADVLALCSESEASPLVVKEAVACGLPVVTTDVGDVGRVITRPSRGTITPREETAFYRAVLERLTAGGTASGPGTPAAGEFSGNIVDQDRTLAEITAIYQEVFVQQPEYRRGLM